MKALLAAVMFLAFTVPAFAADKTMDSKEHEAIQKLAQDFFAAWNKNDVAVLTTFWTDDAMLINPFGRVAHGKKEIQQLFADEQSTVFKGSVAAVTNVKTRPLGKDIAFFDEALTVDNAHSPDGAALPQMNFHIAGVAQMKGNKWQLLEARPYAFLPPPPASVKSN